LKDPSCSSSAASTDDDLHVTGGDLLPVPGSLSGSQVRVQYGDAVESGSEALTGLWGEADFGDQDDRLPPVLNNLLNRADVDFGFATAGDAMEQKRLVCVGIDMMLNRGKGLLLFGIESQVVDSLFAGDLVCFLLHTTGGGDDQAFFAKCRDRADGAANGFGEFPSVPVLDGAVERVDLTFVVRKA